jgi:hypothetical protein
MNTYQCNRIASFETAVVERVRYSRLNHPSARWAFVFPTDRHARCDAQEDLYLGPWLPTPGPHRTSAWPMAAPHGCTQHRPPHAPPQLWIVLAAPGLTSFRASRLTDSRAAPLVLGNSTYLPPCVPLCAALYTTPTPSVLAGPRVLSHSPPPSWLSRGVPSQAFHTRSCSADITHKRN